MEFRAPILSDLKAIEIYKEDFLNHDEAMIHGSGKLHEFCNLEDWLNKVMLHEIDPPEGSMKSTQRFLCENNEVIGTVNIRHGLNDFLYDYGGHIGYSIAPKYRGKGYSSILLRNALDFCREELNLDEVLILTATENTPSIRLLKRFHGVYTRSNTIEGDEFSHFMVPTKKDA